ncbi:helix-turn-helix domain-containing protein [Priestia megaterium]|uniref:helix-turn-helix domain-containing protein n=1 Tax=Priestia megaterium TaxID=1404 RepID=UPI00345A9993
MAKNAISIIASEATYENLSTFKTIEELNETVRAHKEAGADILNKTQVAVLDLLHRYSAKYKGVSFLAKNKIAELIGKSRRTVIRACQALEEAGIIRQYEMKRKSDMQQTSNAIVIMPIEATVEQVPVTQERAQMTHQEDKTFLKQNPKNINTTREDAPAENYPSFIPSSFVNKVKPYFPKLNDVYQLWGKVRLGYIKSTTKQPIDTLNNVVEDIMTDAIAALKLNRISKGQTFEAFKGYVYGTARRTFDIVRRQEVNHGSNFRQAVTGESPLMQMMKDSVGEIFGN